MEPFLGQIQMFGFSFAPRGWALCDGQLLPISSNTALFSLLATTFGGDGRTTFGLPDLRGRDAVHVGSGPGLPAVTWGQKAGTHTYTLGVNNLPPHNHGVRCNNASANEDSAQGHFPGSGVDAYESSANADMNAGMTTNTGSGQSFDVTEPFLGIIHCIALVGIFPSRN